MTSEVGIKVSKSTAGKIGLFGAMSVIIGGVIGIGIFFKNNGIFNNNNGNATGVLVSWIIAIVIGLATAYSYGEIVSAKDKSANSGLGGWSNKFAGNWLGRIVKINQPFFYYAIYVVTGAVFAAEAILNCFMRNDSGTISGSISMWMIMLVALGVIVLFLSTNAFVGRANKKFSQITSPIKFIPLLLVICLGVIFGVMHSNNNLFTHPGNVYQPGGSTNNLSGEFDINGVFMSLPPILFALDSFLVVGNIASDVKNPEKNIPLSILLSMILSGAVYLFVTIGQIFTGCGNAYNLIDFIFTNGNGGNISDNLKIYATICDAIISIFIVIAIFGVVNSLSMGCVASAQASINENIIFGSYKLIRFCKGRENLPGFISAGIMVLFFWVALGIPSMMMNTDQFMDGASNLVVILFFTIYGIVAIYSVANRQTQKITNITKSWGQVPMALVGGVGCVLITAYAATYTYFANVIVNSDAPNGSWGLFLQNSSTLNQWQSAIVFWSLAIFFIGLPFANDLLIKRFKPHYIQQFIWEKRK